MADHEAIKKRKELWKSVLQTMHGNLPRAGFSNLAATNTNQLKAAANYFDLDLENGTECAVLLRVLADIAFNKKNPGRKKGSKSWPAARFFVLGYHENLLRQENPSLSGNERIAKKLKERYPDQFRHDSLTTLRQRLPAARREYARAVRLFEPKPPSVSAVQPKVLGLNTRAPVLGL
jgi:hypothetical protein